MRHEAHHPQSRGHSDEANSAARVAAEDEAQDGDSAAPASSEGDADSITVEGVPAFAHIAVGGGGAALAVSDALIASGSNRVVARLAAGADGSSAAGAVLVLAGVTRTVQHVGTRRTGTRVAVLVESETHSTALQLAEVRPVQEVAGVAPVADPRRGRLASVAVGH